MTAGSSEPVIRAVRSWVAEQLGPVDPIIVACSGGADSLALAVACLTVVSGERELLAATVDHDLQSGSAARAAATAELLSGLGYRRTEVLTVTVDGPGGMEAAARRARYRALGGLAQSVGETAGPARAVAVLLAHTADDQAETVLLGLARGSGPRSIAGMRAWRPPWGRPLLGVGRSDTEAVCRAAGLEPWQDPHNADPVFTRVRLRHEVIPLLDDVLGGGVRPALARTATLMAQDLDALDWIAGNVVTRATRADGSLDIAELAGQPVAITARVLRLWATAGGAAPLTFDHLSRMAGQLDRKGPVQVRIPGGLDVTRTGNTLSLEPARTD